MVPQKLQLRKIRTLSDCLNDVIQFTKQEFKPLLRGFFAICGFFILISAIFYGIYSGTATVSIWRSIFNGGNGYEEGYSYSSLYGGSYLPMAIFSFATQASIYTYIACYLKVYEEKGNISPATDEVWAKFKQYFFPILGYFFLFGILTMLGFIFCIAPGVYLGTVFAPFGFICVMDSKKTQGSVINTCFTLIKGNFWPSLGVYFICGLIYYVFAAIIGLFVGGITGLISYFTTNDLSFVTGIVSSILNIFSVLFSIVLYLGIGMQYLSLEEKENGTGLMNRIDDMGTTNDTSFTAPSNE